jgi:hypothetical protein
MAKAADNSLFGADRRSITLSVLLHVVLVLLAAFGLPAILPDRPEPEPMVMTVEILPISEITNVKPSQKPIAEEKKAPAKAPKPTPPKPTPKPAPTPPKPAPKVEKEEVVEKPFDPTEGEEPKKEEKPKEDTKKQEDELKKLLDSMREDAAKAEKDAKDKETVEKNTTISDKAYDDSLPLSISEMDAIRSQFIPCWSPPIGAKDAGNLVVVLQARYKPDGSLIDVKISSKQSGRYRSDPFFRAAADSAIRAVNMPKCNPLKNLNQDKYGTWKDMELTFDPSIMAGY